MKKYGIFIVIFLLLIGIIWFVGTRNKLVLLDEQVKSQWAQVENQLQRRYDLIPNLVNTVKGYARHEKEIFTQIAEARAKLAQAKSVGDKIKASNSLEGFLGRLLVIVERYPNLKANKTFTRLMDELAGTENRLAVSRRNYNETVKIYNQTIRLFPASMIAGMLNFNKIAYFEIESKVKENPSVSFE